MASGKRSAEVPDRKEQLRRVKRAQRARERARGLQQVELRLPAGAAAKLRAAAKDERFGESLERFLDGLMIRVRDYPALSELLWNVAADTLPARDVLGIYERNWRFVQVASLSPHERALIDRLAVEFGGGIIHA